jgi:RNA polymerase sigma-70 factor (ECF subfamily)
LDEADLADALRAAIGGDEGGFARLWRSLQPGLLRYLRALVGEGAEDAASETWLQAARDLARFDGNLTAFRVWLFRIARNRAIDELRRIGRRREDLREPTDQDVWASDPDVALQVLEHSDTSWALSLIAALPRDQGESVMLRVVAGLDVASTAQVLGKRPGAVRIATMRGLRRLAAHPEVQARAAGSSQIPAARSGTAESLWPEGGVTR